MKEPLRSRRIPGCTCPSRPGDQLTGGGAEGCGLGGGLPRRRSRGRPRGPGRVLASRFSQALPHARGLGEGPRQVTGPGEGSTSCRGRCGARIAVVPTPKPLRLAWELRKPPMPRPAQVSGSDPLGSGARTRTVSIAAPGGAKAEPVPGGAGKASGCGAQCGSDSGGTVIPHSPRAGLRCWPGVPCCRRGAAVTLDSSPRASRAPVFSRHRPLCHEGSGENQVRSRVRSAHRSP